MKMKIIQVDNFQRDVHDDVLVCENVNESYGNLIVNVLNHKYSGEHSSVFYRLVEDDHELYKYDWGV
jgi:hypothetical protein